MASDTGLGYRTMVNSPLPPDTRGYEDDKTSMSNDQENIFAPANMMRPSSRIVNQIEPNVTANRQHKDLDPMDKLLAKLNQNQPLVPNSNMVNTGQSISAHNYRGYTVSTPPPATPSFDIYEDDSHNSAKSGGLEDNSRSSQHDSQAAFYKAKLEEAEARIARMDQELTQTRITKHTVEQATGGSSEADFPLTHSVELPDLSLLNINAGTPQFARDSNNPWAATEARQATNVTMPGHGMERARAVWGNTHTQLPSFAHGYQSSYQFPQGAYGSGGNGFPAPWMPRQSSNVNQFSACTSPSGVTQSSYFKQDREQIDFSMPQNVPHNSVRGNTALNNRAQMAFPSAGNFDGTASNVSYNGHAFGAHLSGPSPASTGTGGPLSPYAPEFSLNEGTNWKHDESNAEDIFLPTTEPLNYRRMLDRSVSCDWRYIVDKIVCGNDQQASIFLQQKLKVATPEQKYDIIEAIVSQAYPLMINRFGNFLVQRCFEHGTSQQVIKIAQAIRGNTLNLSMDAFGCHVVQKAFDSVPEEYKAIMVGELLRRIPETVIHRYACHVWQKLFELRWTTTPPQIMKYVNESLHGMWHEVALGETGSLVVQNIFENCLEDDKRPCIEEVLASIDIVAHGQFGNWCIQHICEHGAPADRSRAIDHVIRYATEYSMDQFASKVVEKCLKISGTEFLNRYLDRVCQGTIDRPRIPLIDIASDQYGNYLIQYILTNSGAQHKEVVAAHIRKHMVSLRGSKFGSRVGMLCTNPAVSTRPGLITSAPVVTRMPLPPSQQSRFNNSYGR